MRLLQVVLLATLISVPHQAQVAQPSAQRAATNPGLLTSHPPADVDLGPVDWIFVIDTSASMSGVGTGAVNIFPQVQDTLRRFVPEIRDGDSMAVFVFDVTSRPILKMQIQSDSDRNAIGPLINALDARGARTHTGAALTDALTEVYSRRDKGRPTAIILLTDGHEDVKGIPNPIRIPDAVNLIRDQDVPYVFYVSLGTTPDPQLSNFLDRINKKAGDHGKTFNDPVAKNLLETAKLIRGEMERTRFKLKIQPGNLELPRLHPGGGGGPYTIEISSSSPAELRLATFNLPPEYFIEGLPETLNVGPEKIQRVQFNVKVGAGAREGIHDYIIRITPPREIDPNPRDIQVRANVHWSRLELGGLWLYDHWVWLLLLLLIILMLVYFSLRWYIYSEDPWEVISSFATRKSPAVLHTPEGRISLAQPVVTLGEGGSKLRNSTAKINIRREGNRHRLIVEKGSVEFMDKLGRHKFTLENERERKLEHNDRLVIPGYQGSLVYLNSSRRR
jgi:hypothetical protein